ncbi:TRAP transporter substrate-binding protein DctP [Hydrogenophaga electricum]|uniref:C4-dicarboxylate ABC transporter substrate-binding protein n=1 Tax=Hydrogenophaga electricum TaxID=1230953 RepID=A0ABQ6CBG0_9BURK|nr:TRAP transporter substrate-binding protein DctP [Hydrogenophaga electricum]GLS16019.1 C4-dicarboxylate ABC transporter substrate-binding protein [Hydrogenophaga electricum]
MHRRLALAALGLSAAFTAQANPEFKWTLAYLPVTGTTYYDVAQQLPERLSKATQGRLQVTANGSLVPGNRLLEAVRDGDVQMSLVLSGYYSASQPLFTLVALPGYSESFSDLEKIMASPYGAAVRDVFARDYKAREVLYSAFCPQTMFSTKPVTKVEDWNGLRVRVNNAGTAVLANVLAAKPVSLSAGEVLPALQRGVIDAVITDSCWAYGAGFYTAVKYAAGWKLGSVVPWHLVVGNEAWAKLPADLQKTVAAELAKVSQELRADYAAKVEALPKQWGAKGVTYQPVSDAENRKVQDARYMGPVLDAWYKQAQARNVDARQWESVAREALGR